jgi:hypothetical protein
MQRNSRKLALLALALLLPIQIRASWLSEITGIDINIPAGTVEFHAPRPQAIPEMLRNLPQDVGQAFLNPMGATLATAIRHASAQARYSSQPLPQDVAEGLQPYFPPNILGRARWTVYDPQRITIDSAITSLWDPAAITLDDIIVFRVYPSLQRDWGIWAHELVHVGQYHNMGVEGFANLYSVAWNSLEQPAYDWGEHVAQQMTQSPNERATFWSVAPDAFAQPLQSAYFAQAAQNYYPPATCANWMTILGGAQITNVCPIPIAITGWEQINPLTGTPYYAVCSSNCWIGPGLTKPFASSIPGMWTNIFFRY